MAPTTSMDPFDGFDDPFGIGGSDVFGHALNDFDIWGDDEDFNPGSSNNMTKEFPGDDFTVGTEPMSSSDRSSRTYSPKNTQRRSSRTLDSKSRTTMHPKMPPAMPIPSQENTENSSGHNQQQRQHHDETGMDKSSPRDSIDDGKCNRRTPLVRRHSSGPRRQSKTKLGRETSIRQLVTLLNASDENLDYGDSLLQKEEKEVGQKVGPVVSKSVHHTRSLRTKSRSIRNLSDQTIDPRCGGDATKMDFKTEKSVDKSARSDTLEDELRKASNRLRDSSRPQLSRSNSANRKTRDELRSVSSRHLISARPSLSMNGPSVSRPRRASSMMPSVLTDSTNSSSTCENKVDGPENLTTTTKREPPRRNLTRSTSFGRRKAPSRNPSLTVSNAPANSLGDSNQKLSLSDDEVVEDLQDRIPTQEQSMATTKREPPRRNLTRSTSFGRRKAPSRNASLTVGIAGSLVDSNTRVSVSDDEVLENSQSNLPKQENLIATTRREPSRRSLVRTNSFGRRKPPSRITVSSNAGDSSPGDSNPRLSLADDEVFEDLQSDNNVTRMEPSRGNLRRSISGRRKAPLTHASHHL